MQARLRAQERELQRTLAACTRYTMLSTLPYAKSDFWNRVVTTIPVKTNWLSKWSSRFGLPDITLPVRLVWQARRYDIVLLAGGERADLLAVALAGLLPWIRTPHIVVDAHWQQDTGLTYLLQKLLLRLGNRLIVEVQPHSEEEVALYHEIFGIPLAKLRAIPWSTSLTGYMVEPRNGDYILTGGLSLRDYDTFFAAVQRLDLPVRVGLPRDFTDVNGALRIPQCPQLSIHTTWTNAEYIAQTAACRVFAMPIQAGLTRSTADQTILNAMAFGKVVVATDTIGSRIYLRHGVNGFLVPESSVDGWEHTLREAYLLPEDAYRTMSQQAAYDAQVLYNERLRLARVLQSACDALATCSQ